MKSVWPYWERKSIYSTTELISTPVEFRCRILEFGCRILKFGCRILEFGCRILLVEYIDLRSQSKEYTYPTFHQDDEDRPLALKKKKKRLMADITELIQLSDSDEAEGEDDNFNDAVAANIDPDPLTLKRFDIRVDYSEFETGFLATLPKAKIRLNRIQTPNTGMVVEKILQWKLNLADTDLAENLYLKDTPQKIWATIFDFYYISPLEIAENLVLADKSAVTYFSAKSSFHCNVKILCYALLLEI